VRISDETLKTWERSHFSNDFKHEMNLHLISRPRDDEQNSLRCAFFSSKGGQELGAGSFVVGSAPCA
jgi:hypothetical protein